MNTISKTLNRFHAVRLFEKGSIKALAASFLSTAALGFTSSALALPPGYTAQYNVYKGKMSIGQATVKLTYNGNRYDYSKSSRATGFARVVSGDVISERSSGTVNGQQVMPSNYSFSHKSKRKKRSDKITFSRQGVQGHYKGKAYKLPFSAGMQDRASLELSITQFLAQNRPNFTLRGAERGQLKNYRFTNQANQRFSTPSGSYTGSKVTLVHGSKNRKTELWFAKELGYIPVKIVHHEKGDIITTLMQRYTKQ